MAEPPAPPEPPSAEFAAPPGPPPACRAAHALWQRLVLKEGVGLGGLRDDERLAALCLASWALPGPGPHTEAQVNAALQDWLAGAGRFVDTDHVELRRWLVDTAWWQRDGYGRAYWATPADQLREDLRHWWAAREALALATRDGAGLSLWIDGLRQADATARAQRRQAWEARQGAPAQPGSAPQA